MFQKHWGLRDDPFRNWIDPRRFFRSASCDEALARLHFLVDGGWRLGLVLGPSGSGKSLLGEVFASELRRSAAQVARVALAGLEPGELLAQLARQLDLNPGPHDSAPELWQAIGDHLVENRYQRIRSVVIFDDVDRAAAPLREQIVRLLNANDLPDSRLSVVVATDAEHFARLGRLVQLADLRIDLHPWTLDETDEYLRWAVKQAGGPRPVFNRAAIERIHTLSRGIPRRINQLAEMAILAGAASALRQVDAETIEAVDGEFGLPLAGAQTRY